LFHDGLLFPSVLGTPFSQSNLHKDFQAVLKVANLPKIRFHDLRHTAASLILNYDIPVLVASRQLGHANSSVTMNIYAHTNVEMQSEAAKLMDELVTPIPVVMPDSEGVVQEAGERNQLHPIWNTVRSTPLLVKK